MRVFSCRGDCSTAEALRGEVQHLRELIKQLLLAKSPEAAAALLAHDQQQQQKPAEKPPELRPWGNRTVVRHPRMLAQLAELEHHGKGIKR